MRTFDSIFGAAIAVVLCFGVNQACAETIIDDNLHFSVTIPADFHRDSRLADTNPNLLYGFRGTASGDIGTVILLERLHGTIGMKSLDLSKMPAGFTGKIVKMFWQGFQLDAVEIPEDLKGVAMITYNVQIPLKEEAIQLAVAGRREQKEQLLQLTEATLGTLRGESNWAQSGTSAAPDESNSGVSYRLLAFPVMLIAMGMTALWFLRLHTPRGVVLSVSGTIFIIGRFLSHLMVEANNREMAVVVGSVALLAFLGGLLGVYDIYAKRKPKNDPLRRSANHSLSRNGRNPV